MPEVVNQGVNAHGNIWYKYSDGSYSYDNVDNSQYREEVDGTAAYLPPDGSNWWNRAPGEESRWTTAALENVPQQMALQNGNDQN